MFMRVCACKSVCMRGKGRYAHYDMHGDLYHLKFHNSSLEGATKLKFVSFCSS